jgi:hypothetical protein
MRGAVAARRIQSLVISLYVTTSVTWRGALRWEDWDIVLAETEIEARTGRTAVRGAVQPLPIQPASLPQAHLALGRHDLSATSTCKSGETRGSRPHRQGDLHAGSGTWRHSACPDTRPPRPMAGRKSLTCRAESPPRRRRDRPLQPPMRCFTGCCMERNRPGMEQIAGPLEQKPRQLERKSFLLERAWNGRLPALRQPRHRPSRRAVKLPAAYGSAGVLRRIADPPQPASWSGRTRAYGRTGAPS